MSEEKPVFDAKDLAEMLEPLIRRVVREEQGGIYLSDDSPLYEDLLDTLERKERGEFKFYTHEEVFGE